MSDIQKAFRDYYELQSALEQIGAILIKRFQYPDEDFRALWRSADARITNVLCDIEEDLFNDDTDIKIGGTD